MNCDVGNNFDLGRVSRDVGGIVDQDVICAFSDGAYRHNTWPVTTSHLRLACHDPEPDPNLHTHGCLYHVSAYP